MLSPIINNSFHTRSSTVSTTSSSSNGKTTSVTGDSSPISSKKVSRKRAIIDDDSDEDITPPVTKHATQHSPTSATASTSSDMDQPCSSSSLQTSPAVLSTPPKRVTGTVYVCTMCVWLCSH